MLIYRHLTAVRVAFLNTYIGRSKDWLKVKMVTTPSRSSQVAKSVEEEPNKQQLDFTIEIKFENLVK